MSDKVDRNVTVHLRARQADIYEKALRDIIEVFQHPPKSLSERELKVVMHNLAAEALKAAERVK